MRSAASQWIGQPLVEHGDTQAAEPITNEVLDDIVSHLNLLYVTGSLAVACNIGEYVLEKFFHGDMDAFRARGRKDVSLRRLAERPDLHVSYSYLYQAVAVVEQMRQLPPELGHSLPLTHHKLLLAVKTPELKAELARSALDEVLSSRALAEAVRNARDTERGGESNAGRPTTPAFVKALGGLTALGVAAQAERIEPRQIHRMGRERTLALVGEAMSAIDALEDLIDQIQEVLEEGET